MFVGSLFVPSRRGVIDVNNSTVLLATIAFDLLLLICYGLLIGINRRVLARFNLIKEGKEEISDR
ncbi:MAG: hypothetical protein WBQ25_04915 [Nitrososphaeraceae archaeon]